MCRPDPRPQPRSSMKVRTLDESLASCDSSLRAKRMSSMRALLSTRRLSAGQSERAFSTGDHTDTEDDPQAESLSDCPLGRAAEHQVDHQVEHQVDHQAGHQAKTPKTDTSRAQKSAPLLRGLTRGLSFRFARNKRSKAVTPKAEGLSKQAREEASVQFCDVSIREYEVTASDNPAVREGVAIELGWNYHSLSSIPFDQFETKRSKERTSNFLKEKRLTRHERERILREFGATQKDIQQAAKRAAIVRNKRKKSVSLIKHDRFHETLEEKKDWVRGMMTMSSTKKKGVMWKENDMDYERLHPSLMTQ